MSDLLNGITLSVGIVIHRVNAPCIAGTVMFGMNDPVHQGVPHKHVGMAHVYFGTKHPAAVGKFTVPHPGEQICIFFNAPVPPGTVRARGGNGTPVQANFFLRLVVYVSQALVDQDKRPLVQLFKIIRGIEFVSPLKTKPLYIIFYRINVFRIFFYGICIVKTQVGLSTKLSGQAKIQANALAWPMCRYPLGSGGNLVMMDLCFP